MYFSECTFTAYLNAILSFIVQLPHVFPASSSACWPCVRFPVAGCVQGCGQGTQDPSPDCRNDT